MKVKTIFIYSHKIEDKKLKKKILKNKDEYDSQIEVWENGVQLWKGVCNVDSSVKLEAKIEIQNGVYPAIVGMHKGKYKAILILNQKPKFQDWKKLQEKERILPTININPKWKKNIAKYINLHMGGDSWDWSEGCITIHKNDYERFIELFEINEIINLEKV